MLVAACGRIGFESSSASPAGDGNAGGGNGGDGNAGDGNAGDAAAPAIACADMNLGSALGPMVATGSTAGKGNNFQGCGGDGNDITFGWFAPATGSYLIDLCASQALWDSVLSVRDGSCTGPQLACSDDACGGPAGLQGRVTVNLTVGQGIVIVVDSAFPQDGNYQLAITQR